MSNHHFSVRVRVGLPVWEAPSIFQGTWMPARSATVGSRSTCSQLRSSTVPVSWPGALTNWGTHIRSGALVSPRLRGFSPGTQPSPWSAPITTSDLSHMPSALSLSMTCPTSPSV